MPVNESFLGGTVFAPLPLPIKDLEPILFDIVTFLRLREDNTLFMIVNHFTEDEKGLTDITLTD